MSRKPRPRAIPYTPEQARKAARSIFARIEMAKGSPNEEPNYASLGQTLVDYADLRERADAEGVEL